MLAAADAGAQGCAPCSITGRIDGDIIERTVRELSGADSVLVAGTMVRIATRSALLSETDIAREYLLERIEELGYEAARQTVRLNVSYPDLQAAEISLTGDSLWLGSDEGEVLLMTAAGGWGDAAVISTIDARIQCFELDRRGRLWAACKSMGTGFGELHYSDDGGASWQAYVIGSALNEIYSLNALAFSPGGDAALACGSFGTALRLQYVAGDWYMTILDASTFLYRHINGCAFSGPVHVWTVTNGGSMFESVDLGANWTMLSPGAETLWDIEFSGSMSGIAVGDGVVRYTGDGGNTWDEAAAGADLFTVTMFDPSRAVAAGASGAVMTTADGGETWAPVDHGCDREEDIFETMLSPPDTVWAVGRNMPLRLEISGTAADCMQWALSDTIYGVNYIFSIPGRTLPEEKVIVCAHFDSRSWEDEHAAPGADDNATGTSGVLEIARAMSGALFDRSVEFILFDGEEIGLLGSRHYVEKRDTLETIAAVLNLDMIGRDYGGGVKMLVSGRSDPLDSSLAALVAAMADTLMLDIECEYDDSALPTSDHKPFWEIEGVPSVLLIENEYRNNPHYHNSSDVAEYVDFDYVTDIVSAAAGAAVHIAGLISADPLPASVVLHQNFPNPLFASTRIRFELPVRMPVDLTLFDLSGRVVLTMIHDTLEEGRHEYVWKGRNRRGGKVQSGVYFLRLKAGETVLSRKIVVVR